MPNFIWKQGDGGPAFVDTLTYPDGSCPNLDGATVKFVMRSLLSPSAIVRDAQVTSPGGGGVSFAPTSADTNALVGNLMASWVVTLKNATDPITFPLEGYLWGTIEPSVSAATTQIVSLPDLKENFGFRASQRNADHELLTMIDAVGAQIEFMVGPVIPRISDEWHDGGSRLITVDRRPTTGFGAEAVYELIAASEYQGASERPLSIVRAPNYGSLYSIFMDKRMGTVTRRSSGGGVVAFPPGENSVHLIYRSGLSVIPPNIRLAAIEIIRAHYRTTAPAGRGRSAIADVVESTPMPFWVPHKAREMLAPHRRFPSIA